MSDKKPDKETELYLPVKEYLEKLGFKVNAEVKNCDIVASINSKIIIVELKNHFSLKLIYQAIDRQEISDSVYVAIGNRTTKTYPANIKKIKKLLTKLNIGLLIVHFRISTTFVEPVLEVQQKQKNIDRKKRMGLLKEMDGRYKNFNIGGSTPSKEQITTYKLNTIQIAAMLDVLGESSPSYLIKNGSASNTQSILARNFSGWFEKTKRGVYKLNSNGKKALLLFSEQSSYFKENIQNIEKNDLDST